MRIAAIAFSGAGCETLNRVRDSLVEHTIDAICRTKADTHGIPLTDDINAWAERCFREYDALLFVGATGIAVRHIAPFIRRKDTDPAVICMDERGRFVIPLLSGHIGGANELALEISDVTGAVPVVTTATDINDVFAVDTFAVKNQLRIGSLKAAKEISAALLRNDDIGFFSDVPYRGDLPKGLVPADGGPLGISISKEGKRPFDVTLLLTPMDITVGVGCRRGTDPSKLEAFVHRILEEENIDPRRVGVVRSIDIKSDEEAIIQLSKGLESQLDFRSAEELMKVEGDFESSEFVLKTTGADNVCERSALYGGGELIRKKTAEDGMTVALGRRTVEPGF